MVFEHCLHRVKDLHARLKQWIRDECCVLFLAMTGGHSMPLHTGNSSTIATWVPSGELFLCHGLVRLDKIHAHTGSAANGLLLKACFLAMAASLRFQELNLFWRARQQDHPAWSPNPEQ
jgi:hypothetical protein